MRGQYAVREHVLCPTTELLDSTTVHHRVDIVIVLNVGSHREKKIST